MSLHLSALNWQIILIIIAISAVVSYVGDILGMRIGKRRISLFGLRPRYTSTVVTMCTGVGIALLTVLVASIMSESVRGVFVRNYMDQQLRRLTSELSEKQYQLDLTEMDAMSARSELVSLKDEKALVEGQVERIRAELAEMKEGRVIAFQGELLAQTSVERGVTKAALEAALTRLIQAAEENLSLKLQERFASRETLHVVIDASARDEVERAVLSSGVRKVLRLVAPSNLVMGQVVSGQVDVRDSREIYRKDSVLKTETLSGRRGAEDAANALYAMLRQINRMAVSDGVLPDPISGAVGNLDTMEFYDIVDQISDTDEEKIITFLAATDIYTEGPVNIRIEVANKK